MASLPTSIRITFDLESKNLLERLAVAVETLTKLQAVTPVTESDPSVSAPLLARAKALAGVTTPAGVEAAGFQDPDYEQSAQERAQCACPNHSDPVSCIDLRYHGHYPGPNSDLPREHRDECQCNCHDELTDDEAHHG